MELFERIRYLSEIKGINLAKIARFLSLSQQNFHQWLKPGSQKNLWEHLPKILELFPDVRPEWLYMGQEPIFKEDAVDPAPTRAETEELKAEISRLKEELAEADRINRKLVARLLTEGTQTSGDFRRSAKAAEQE